MLDKLDYTQRRSAKIVLGAKSSDAEGKLKWLPLSRRRDLHIVNYTFKCLKGQVPDFMKDYFMISQTRYNTKRNGKDLKLPRVKTEAARKAFYFNGARTFNDLPIHVKESNSIVLFKNQTMNYYTDMSF